ncbi:L,D-transpeptidase [Longispora fulva]|uniref:Lipoprotein-anchoring transpeptidase ErfK/SrfK n=1 Tax=Longispora fulva TaxID=619741 RepID=A0A8J7H097_9ACTN|nr:Ig-like domain-containing protein [Longispora fulva]MBG6141766.1 lipoprotein-anchoring transpeptidase ErfK/SrfK [Longispora fulva]
MAKGMILGLVLVLGGCTAPQAHYVAAPSPAPPAAPVTAAVTSPAPGETGVSTALEIRTTVTGTSAAVVTLTGPGGPVAGEPYPDGASWIPAAQLAYATSYTATVTATGADGRRTAASSTFTTMAAPGRTAGSGLYPPDGETVGVGMPVVVELGRDVADDRREAVQRRLSVRSDPPQVGGWHWFSAHEVHYRPQAPWRTGTRIDVRLGIGGLDMGGWYGEADRSGTVTVGPDQRLVVDNGTKQMTVTRDGAVLRTIPVSLGKPSMPSSSGNLVVMEKAESMVFDSSTFGVPVNSPDGYRTTVYWDLRLTWGGEFVHAAPWSVGDQGERNVSHGCVNMSTENATWLFHLAQRGDMVTVAGTEAHVGTGDGWTDWELGFDQYQQVGPSPRPGLADAVQEARQR